MRCLRVALVLAFGLLAATVVMAQEKEKGKGRTRLSPVGMAMLRIERFHEALEQLGLTDEQKEKIKKIREENAPKLKEIHAKMRDVLTDEQKKTLDEQMKSAKESGKKGRAMIQSVEASLNLTDEQKEKLAKIAPEIRAVHEEAVQKVKEVLTPEQQTKLDESLQAKKGRKKSES